MCLWLHTSQKSAKRLGLVSWANRGQELGGLTVASSADLCKSKTKQERLNRNPEKGLINTVLAEQCSNSYSHTLMVGV